MAKQIVTKLLCDMTGEDADETVSFALDGVLYSIDLTRDLAGKLRSTMEEFLQSAERVGKVGQGAMLQGYRPRATTPGRIPAAATAASRRARNAAIRAWANENGYGLSERGRIPQYVQDAYENRNSSQSRAQQLALETGTDAQGDIVPSGADGKPAKTSPKTSTAPAAAFAHA